MFLFLPLLLQAADDPTYDEAVVMERLKSIEDPLVENRYNSIVKGYIKGYLFWNRDKAERILGRTVMYFPLMEEYLSKRNMPDKLKYLSVVESALYPHAVSRVGAVGLWQFMPETGKEYGLEINEFVDERKDPNKSTQAALDYLGRDPDGFFLMVEGSQIDWGGHENNADYLIGEELDFDKTIGVVLDYAQKHPETLVIVTADHETGGFTLAADHANKMDGDYNRIAPSFSTSGHSTTLIPVFAKGPGQDNFGGIYENNQLFHKILDVLRLEPQKKE